MVCNSNSVVGGGSHNRVCGSFSGIFAGNGNTSSGICSAILGGSGNNDNGLAWAGIFGCNINIATCMGAKTFHANCLNAKDTPLVITGVPTGLAHVTIFKNGVPVPAANVALPLYIVL